MEPLAGHDPERIGPFPLTGRSATSGVITTFVVGGRSDVFVDAWPAVAGPDVGSFSEFQTRVRQTGLTEPVDGGVDGAWAWLATRDGHAPTLASDVAASGPLGPVDWYRLGATLASGLEAMHRVGLRVGRLTPTDVLIGTDGGSLRSLAAPFAAFRGDVQASVPPMAWFAPELLGGAEPSPATDLHHLGGLLAFAATGREPWGPETTATATLVTRIESGEVDLAGVDPDRASVIRRLLELDPQDRPTAREAAAIFADVVAALDSGPQQEPGDFEGPPHGVAAPVDVDVTPVPEPTTVSAPTLDLPVRSRQIAPPGFYDPPSTVARTSKRRAPWVLVGAIIALVVALGVVSTVLIGRSSTGEAQAPVTTASAGATASSASPRASNEPSESTPEPSPEQSMRPSVRINYQSTSIPDRVFLDTLDWVFDVCSTDRGLLDAATTAKVAMYRREAGKWVRIPTTARTSSGGRCGTGEVNLLLDATALAPAATQESGVWSRCSEHRVVIPATKKYAKTYVDMCVQTRVSAT